MLNRLYKSNEFGRIKPRMHNDRVIYVLTPGVKFANLLCKALKDDNILPESELLSFFKIDHSELGGIVAYY